MPSAIGRWKALRPLIRPVPASALIDDSGIYRLFEIVRARCAAGIDKAGAAHETVGHLIAREIDRMIAGQVGVNALVEFAVTGITHVQRFVAAVYSRAASA